jgi:hypothetical protein
MTILDVFVINGRTGSSCSGIAIGSKEERKHKSKNSFVHINRQKRPTE